MGITFDEALNENLISKRTLDILNRKCKCGSDLVFSDSLNSVRCTKHDCKTIIINRINEFCKKIGLSLGYNYIEMIINRLSIITPYQVLMLDMAYERELITLNDIPNIETIVQELKIIKDREYFIYSIVDLCCINNLSNVAESIFGGFQSIEDAYTEIENGQLSFINERIGIDNSDSCVISIDLYNKIIENKEEILFGCTQLKVKKTAVVSYKIAFNDGHGGFISKREAVDYLNNRFKLNFILVTNISESTDILINNFDNASSKYRAANIINDNYIADGVNKGTLKLASIGKSNGTLKPIGSKIFICNMKTLIDKLSELRVGV